MSLLQLPPEILIHIFDCIGSSSFRSDLSRLTVCKQWSTFALTACFRDFYVNPKTLHRLLTSPCVGKSLPLIKDSVDILDLGLKGFEDWEMPLKPQHNSQAVLMSGVSTWDTAQGRALREAWTRELNNDLLHLATITNHSRKLRFLRIQATSELHPLLLLARRDYLYLWTIRAYLSATNLTSLELDLCGTQLIPRQSQDHSEMDHICTDIAALLLTLRRLRLRMRSVCTDVLRIPQYSTNLRLNEMLINLGLSDVSPLSTSVTHATRCGFPPGGFLHLKADIEEQAQYLVAQMATPKTVRVLTNSFPSTNLQAFDAVTGEIVTLSEGAEWDDEGEIVKKTWSDKSSEIPDLSSDDE